MAKTDYSNWTKTELIREIEQLRKRKKYGLVWEDKPEEVVEKCKKEIPVLKEINNKEVINDPDSPMNIIIEGDNYHALSVLNYTHKGKIDIIYIDPPYNTGATDWKYNNDYVDEFDSYRHSKWISMMYNRMRLTKDLLNPNGIICVAIDNYEVHNLKHILEDIFPNKEIVITVVQHNYRGRVTNNFALTHEYLLWVVPYGKESITRLDEISEEIRRNLRRTGQNSRRREGPSLFYGIEVNKKTLEIIGVTEPIIGPEFPKSTRPDCEMILPIDKQGVERNWYYAGKRVMDEAARGDVYAKVIKDRIEIHYRQDGQKKLRKSVWTDPKYDSSTYGTELLTEIIGENDFPFPKSLHAVIECLTAASSNKNATILDFFAGSGTTGHAVLELNRRDNGKRKFILCTNNENCIAEEITYPRIRAVLQGYNYVGKEKIVLFEQKISLKIFQNYNAINDKCEEIIENTNSAYDDFETKIEKNVFKLYGIRHCATRKDGLKGNLKYFITSFVPAAVTDKNKTILTQQATEMLCVKESTFNLMASKKDYKIYNNGKFFTGIIFNQNAIQDFKKKISMIDGIFKVYIFSLSDESFEDEFEEMKHKVTLSPIPEAILRVYRRIFK